MITPAFLHMPVISAFNYFRGGESLSPVTTVLVSILGILAAVLILSGSLKLGDALIQSLRGWHRLARTYRARGPAAGDSWEAYGAVGSLWSGFLTFTANDGGLFITRSNLIGPFIKPMFTRSLYIPWEEMHGARPGRSPAAYQMVSLDIGVPVAGRLLLPRFVLEQSAGKVLLPPASVEGTNT